MRIEISAGGVAGGIAVAEFQANISGFLFDTESMISSFKAVKKETYELNGGVGNLRTAVNQIDARIKTEEAGKESAKAVQKKFNEFLDLSIRVDKEVEKLVKKNKKEFYAVHPWMKPVVAVDEELSWQEKAWNWLCGAASTIVDGVTGFFDWVADEAAWIANGAGILINGVGTLINATGEILDEAGRAILDGAGRLWNWSKEQVIRGANIVWDWTKDTARKIWDGAVSFYTEHKKIIDTIVIAVGVVGTVAAVIGSGGTALVPLLTTVFGVSVGTAMTISSAVAVTAAVSTALSGIVNITDIWAEIDNPVFNFIQKSLDITKTVSTITYSIGKIYNLVKGIKGPYIDVKQLNAAQKGALNDYTKNEFYGNINNSLRGLETATSDNMQRIETIHETLKNSLVQEDMVLYRGTSKIVLGELQNLSPEELIGNTFIEKAFMSTSELSSTADKFVKNLKIIIDVPKGSHALNIAPLSVFDEAEYLFDSGQEMLITAAKVIDGILNIRVSL